MITTLHRILRRATAHQWAIPAFNVTNLETVQSVLRGAAALRSPVIVQASETAMFYAGVQTLYGIIASVARTDAPRIPVIVHVDHGKRIAVLRSALAAGFTSIHMDGSLLPLAKNVTVTRRAVALARRHKVTAQGELGILFGQEGLVGGSAQVRAAIRRGMTDPKGAREFVRQTGVDTLAVACGTAHGFFRGIERIDFERLRLLRKSAGVPLVLHGGSGVADAALRRAIKLGVSVINVDTALRLAYLNGLAGSMRSYKPDAHVDIRKHMGVAMSAMEREVRRTIKLFGSAGKAD